MKFQVFAQTLEKIEGTSGRLDMTDILVAFLKDLSKDEIKSSMYLLQGRVVPRFIPLEFNVARKLMMRSISRAFEIDLEKVEKHFAELGDVGLVAEKLSKRKKSLLEINQVYEQLYDMSMLEGAGSQDAKMGAISRLIKDCDTLSCRYVTRMIIGNLRLGLSDKTVLDALSVIAVGDKSKRAELDRAYGVQNDIGKIAEKVLLEGIESILRLVIEPGVPVSAMLCEREETIDKINERMGVAAIQPKYDGLRAQVHFDKKGIEGIKKASSAHTMFVEAASSQVVIFSRNLESLSHMFPEVSEAVAKLGVKSIVLDGEIIAYNENTDEFLPFQETIQRRRKHNVGQKVKDIPVRLYVYDILHLNGGDLLNNPFKERTKLLGNIIKKSQGSQKTIYMTPTLESGDVEKITEVFEEYVARGLEGIIVKSPESLYMPGKRGYDWIKYKKSSKGFVVDTIDAVVLGYYNGRGARAKFGIGAFLIGILNKKTKTFQSIAKVGTGIKDEEWIIIKNKLDENAVDKMPNNVEVSKLLSPDVWVEPQVVVEVEADEITLSSNHQAGIKDGKGYSLRFPRLKLFDRLDKTPEDITTVAEIKKWFDWGSMKGK